MESQGRLHRIKILCQSVGSLVNKSYRLFSKLHLFEKIQQAVALRNEEVENVNIKIEATG